MGICLCIHITFYFRSGVSYWNRSSHHSSLPCFDWQPWLVLERWGGGRFLLDRTKQECIVQVLTECSPTTANGQFFHDGRLELFWSENPETQALDAHQLLLHSALPLTVKLHLLTFVLHWVLIFPIPYSAPLLIVCDSLVLLINTG